MKKMDINRITAMTIIFSLFLSLFSNLAFASIKTNGESPKKLPDAQIVKLKPSESTVSLSLLQLLVSLYFLVYGSVIKFHLFFVYQYIYFS